MAAALGNHLFEQIAITNAERYLNNQFNPGVAYTFTSGKLKQFIKAGICNTSTLDEKNLEN